MLTLAIVPVLGNTNSGASHLSFVLWSSVGWYSLFATSPKKSDNPKSHITARRFPEEPSTRTFTLKVIRPSYIGSTLVYTYRSQVPVTDLSGVNYDDGTC